ncbi:retrovirus polyprotein [Purpureocillium lavendulum]|uniref:Retrovirus polyprotein n=1 Tax=Purpureocillium lavendulum TaxID=1247861 RepID=A0AB34FEQ2_9HYPO|nr:retrovirus polyprotein [Purpureocillium lavendulum]
MGTRQGQETYRTAIYHAAGYGDARRKLIPLALQRPVDLANVAQVVTVLGGAGPRLYQLQHLALDVGVDGDGPYSLKQGHEIVHELARGNFGEEVGSAIFDTGVGELAGQHDRGILSRIWGRRTLRALSCVFGFLLPMRRLSERMASFGATVFERMTSEISRFKAMSSLGWSARVLDSRVQVEVTYKLLLVAFSICSSRAVLADEDHQLIMSAMLTALSVAAMTTRYSLPPDGKRPLPHVEDLVAIPTDIDGNQSIRRLLEQAEAALRQSEMSRDFNRPALALKDYIRASIIAVQAVSNHKDYPAIRGGDTARAHNALLKRIAAQSDAYEKIKRDIILDNKRTGVQPTVARPRPNGVSEASPEKKKPPIHPKPQALHGNSIRSSIDADLAARFANLRGPQSSPGQDPRIKTYPIPAQRPSGPREMPGKLNLDTDALPKVPDAIYSPARGSVSGEAGRLPTSTPRGLFTRTGSVSTEYFPPMDDTLKPKRAPPEPPEQPRQSIESTDRPISRPVSAEQSRPRSAEPPEINPGDDITPQQLYETMRKASILLIDIRSREDFDEGHIMAQSIVCVEPSILLRDNISAEEISESMVLSPRQDQPLFERRETYDLVVFYDQSSDQVVQTPKNSDQMVALSLHRALLHLNYGKELRRPPRILRGGLDAWVDLMGPRSLQTTDPNRTRANKRNGFIQRRGSKYTIRPLQPADVRAWQNTVEQEAQHTATRPSFPRTGEEFLRFRSAERQSMMRPPPPAPRFEQLPAPPAKPRAAVQKPTHSGLASEEEPMRSRKPDGLARAPTGLYNPRNWCYANSTLQALLASPEFSRQLAESEWSHTKVPRKAGEKIDPPQLMIRIISNLFHWMSTGKFETMKAQTLMDYSRHLCKTTDENAQFGGHQQQDAQEFMSFVMDQLHDETNQARDRTGHVEQPSTRGRTVLQAAAAYWDGHGRLNRSLVDRYWRGLDVSTVRCLECGTCTYTFSPFSWISVPVGAENATLADVMARWAGSNALDNYTCDHCRRATRATQSTSLARMPPLFCLGLRRFDVNAQGSLSKSYAAISWDFNDFDFSPYFVDTRDSGGGSADRAFRAPFRYECYAVICHAGKGIETGHYKAYVRDAGTHDPYAWYLCNDSSVSKVRIGSGDGADAARHVFSDGQGTVPYLVFFRRREAG